MFILFVNRESPAAAAFIDDVQSNGGLKIGVPNILSPQGIHALQTQEVILYPLAPAPQPMPAESPGREEETEQSALVLPDTK